MQYFSFRKNTVFKRSVHFGLKSPMRVPVAYSYDKQMNQILCMVRYVIYLSRLSFWKKSIRDIPETDERHLFKNGLTGSILRALTFGSHQKR